MEKNFSELIEYLDKKFSKIEDILETKADKSDLDSLATAVDSYAKKADTYFQEMVALSHKVDRHEKWLLQLAEKLGVKLEY